MKKIYIGTLLSFTTSVFPATIRVYNMLGTNEPVTVSVITPQKRMTEQIEPKQSQFFNSWFNGISGFEWEFRGSRWAAPLQLMPLQTEGRLYIHQHGKYTFKPCLVCKDVHGKATVINPPSAPTPPTDAGQNIPTPPPLPTAPKKPMPTENKNLLQDIQKGTQLRKTEPRDQEATLLEEIKAEKKLAPAQNRELGPKPDTRTPREKLLEDIQKGATLKKTGEPTQKKPQHEMLEP